MTFGPIPLPIQSGDGSDSTITFLGSHAGGNDLAIKTGSASRTLEAKRDGILLDQTDALDGLPAVGSAVVAQAFGLNTSLLTTEYQPIDHVPTYVMVNLPAAATVTGAMFFLTTAGVYTPSVDENRVALYSYDANTGVVTRLKISDDNPSLWVAPAGLRAEPFTTPIELPAGIYFIGFEYGASTTTTHPAMAAAPPVVFATCSEIDLPNGGKTYAVDRVNNTLPASANLLTEADPESGRPWIALY